MRSAAILPALLHRESSPAVDNRETCRFRSASRRPRLCLPELTQPLRVGLHESRRSRNAFGAKPAHLRESACASLYHEFHGSAQIRGEKLVFLGFGGPARKSARLLFVLLQPLTSRKIA